MHHSTMQASSSQVTSSVIIRSPDTNVFVVVVGLSGVMNGRVLFHTGRGNLTRTIDVTAVHNHYGKDVSEALIGLHSFTGCDSVSAFYGKVKTKALKSMLDTFKSLGQSFDVSPQLSKGLEQFVCSLYSGKQGMDDVNWLRYNMFRMDCKFESSLPPNQDSLLLHIRRANYQAAIHRRSLQQFIGEGNLTEHGWVMENGKLVIKWSTLPRAPNHLTAAIMCKCRKGKCHTRQCECVKNKITCTDLCKCIECSNQATEDEKDAEHDIGDDDLSD